MMRVGLCWAGSRGHKNDANRSIPFDTLRPLGTLPGVTWQSLLVGEREAEATDAPWLVKAGDRFPTFAHTAAFLVHRIDLIVSVDTALVHLAGAMGRPVWVLLPAVADFRWQQTGDTSPWYPSVRLFRQQQHGEWGEVIERVMQELTTLTQSKAA